MKSAKRYNKISAMLRYLEKTLQGELKRETGREEVSFGEKSKHNTIAPPCNAYASFALRIHVALRWRKGLLKSLQ